MSMISSTPLTNQKRNVHGGKGGGLFDLTESDIDTPTLYKDTRLDKKRQYGNLIDRMRHDGIDTHGDTIVIGDDVDTTHDTEISRIGIEGGKKLKEELMDWRNNPKKYADQLIEKKEDSWVRKYIGDPSIPLTMSLYLQLILNAVIVGFVILLIWTFVTTIKNDVNKRIDEMSGRLLKEIAVCSKEYLRNNCHPSIRVPAAETACSIWEHCMNQDPASVGQVKISFEVLAEILNGFVKLLSWKTIFVVLLLMVASLVVTAVTFDRLKYPQQQLVR